MIRDFIFIYFYFFFYFVYLRNCTVFVYCESNYRNRNTRNKNCVLKLPVIKKEYFRGSFIYMGAKLYNEMNIDIRKTLNFRKFKTYVKNFYN